MDVVSRLILTKTQEATTFMTFKRTETSQLELFEQSITLFGQPTQLPQNEIYQWLEALLINKSKVT